MVKHPVDEANRVYRVRVEQAKEGTVVPSGLGRPESTGESVLEVANAIVESMKTAPAIAWIR